MNTFDLIDTIENMVQTHINENFTTILASDLGMDSRAGHRLFINKDFIAVRHCNDNSLQYYGGFEYIDADDRVELSDYVLYSANSSRVAEILNRYFDKVEEVA